MVPRGWPPADYPPLKAPAPAPPGRCAALPPTMAYHLANWRILESPRPSPSVDRLFAPSLRAPSPHPAGRAAQLPLPANWRLTPVSLGREAPPAAPPPQG
ncbi:hypothetical protein DTO013F2_10440 [Penicillium roqueforti]|nr:hypothetical protein DTO013F2_10440 [Penicillium roqueforti]